MTDDEEFDWSMIENMSTTDIPDDMVDKIITPLQMKKRIIRDLVPCADYEQVSKMLALHPDSPDVADMEHRESHRRLDGTAPLAKTIGMLSQFASEAAVGSIIVGQEENLVDVEALNEAAERLTPIVYMSVLSIIAEFLDVGYLHLPHGTTIFEVQGE